MAQSKNTLEVSVAKAIDSIFEQFKTNSDLRPDAIFLCNGDTDVLNYFRTILSNKFPLHSYNPVIVIGNNSEHYSIDVSLLLNLYTPKSA